MCWNGRAIAECDTLKFERELRRSAVIRHVCTIGISVDMELQRIIILSMAILSKIHCSALTIHIAVL